MKYLKNYQLHSNVQNESVKSNIFAGILASALVFNPLKVDSNFNFKKAVNATEIVSSKTKNTRDEKLKLILDEIKDNLESNDTSKFIELYNKLSTHIEDKYNYKIEKKEEFKKDGIRNMGILDIVGWLGSICLAFCAIPQALQSYKEKNSNGISWGFLLLWAFGELFTFAYILQNIDVPLLLNYSMNLLTIGVILYYKIKPGKDTNYNP